MNLDAFLSTIAASEGTRSTGDNGYNVLVGSRGTMPILFGSYRDHPRIRVQLRADDVRTPQDEELTSTAAGRYQILARIFDAYKAPLALQDFGKQSQDKIAVQLIRECGALQDVDAGRFDVAVSKCRSRWASLPGAGYGQRENTMEMLRNIYLQAGGTLA